MASVRWLLGTSRTTLQEICRKSQGGVQACHPLRCYTGFNLGERRSSRVSAATQKGGGLVPNPNWIGDSLPRLKTPRFESPDLIVGSDLLPNLPSFIRRVCSGYALVWGVLRTQSV